MTMRIAPLLLAACGLLAGCGLIEVDRLDVEQGNRLDPEVIRSLDTGMTRIEVSELLGSPVLETPFHEDRWEYVYYATEAGSDPERKPRRLTVFFRDGRVARIEDRYEPVDGG